jgi:putative glycosyltransferase (TIGR04348 family)
MSRLVIVTPAPPGSRRGNRVTAERWGHLWGQLGHEVEVLEQYDAEPADALIVLHAGRSAESVRRFRDRYPNRPILLAVTGTDIYGNEFDPAIVARSLEVADRIIVLQPRTADDLPESIRPKVRVIYQSAEPPTRREAPRAGVFEVAVVGHLRPVKDPFRTAEAVRLLPPSSATRIVQMGKALSPEMAEQARNEAETNSRYEWLGDLPHDEALAVMSRCALLAVTSLSEGGPAVIAEAIVAGVPVIATRVSGCVGMLGDDYPGLFAPGDTAGLAVLLDRCERDAGFYASLRAACDRRRPIFSPETERANWRAVLAELGIGREETGA